jgi:hypothetical protein
MNPGTRREKPIRDFLVPAAPFAAGRGLTDETLSEEKETDRPTPNWRARRSTGRLLEIVSIFAGRRSPKTIQ